MLLYTLIALKTEARVTLNLRLDDFFGFAIVVRSEMVAYKVETDVNRESDVSDKSWSSNGMNE